MMDTTQKLAGLQEKLARYEAKLAQKMKRYRGVIHESGLSEMRHNEVMVLRAIVADLKREIQVLQEDPSMSSGRHLLPRRGVT